MGQQNYPLVAFNRGLVSKLGAARADIKRVALSAKTMNNWIARLLGSMCIRPGLWYRGHTKGNAASRFIPFVFSVTDKALLELTDYNMRVWINDTQLSRVAVASALANPDFAAHGSWTAHDDAGCTSAWPVAGTGNPKLELFGNGSGSANIDQSFTVAAGDLGKVHALRVIVGVLGTGTFYTERTMPATLRVGTSLGDDSLVGETSLSPGFHSIAFTPVASPVYVRLSNRNHASCGVYYCGIESAGIVDLPAPWAAADLQNIRYDASADVIFVACAGKQQYRIERRGTYSWSAVIFQSRSGPYRTLNLTPVTLAPSALTGYVIITASAPIFNSAYNQNMMLAIQSLGQDVTASITGLAQATAGILVQGIGATRTINVILTGLTGWGDTIILQRSYDNAAWTAVAGSSWTASVSTTYLDGAGFDNQSIYYRLYCSVYAGGTVAAELTTPSGSIVGEAQATTWISSTQVGAIVMKPFGGTAPSVNWQESLWSDRRGWPTACALYGGRLWFAGKSAIVGSVSDDYTSFDPSVLGDSGPINRTIGSGPVDSINWVLGLQRLILGGDGAEFSCRSSALDDPLSPANFNPKKTSSQGSAAVQAVSVDGQGIFVQRGGTRVFSLTIGGDFYSYDYSAAALTQMIPEIGQPGIVRVAVQRQPDTRIHFVRSDGTVAILIFDKTENVSCWSTFSTEGLVEDAVVLPGDSGEDEDHVYYVVNRTINGATLRNLERWAYESQCHGDAQTCMLADSYVVYSGAPATLITGLSNLEGMKVVVWADGKDVGTASDGSLIYTVLGGQITLAVAASNVVVGLYYEATWQSNKLLELQGQWPTPLAIPKAVQGIGVVASNIHPKGVKLGPDFTTMDNMPEVEGGKVIDPNVVRADYEEQTFEFPGNWSPDSRVCAKAVAPRPCTLLGLILEVEID